MGRLKKFVVVQPEADLPPPPEIDFSKAALDYDSDDFGEWLCLQCIYCCYTYSLSTLAMFSLSQCCSPSVNKTVEIMSDPAYPGQWRVSGSYIEQIARMTHWEYPEAVERFGRQLSALGIAEELERRGASEGDLVMVDKYDFEFAPGMTNPYLPVELLEKDSAYESSSEEVTEEETPWRPFPQGGFLDVDVEELVGFNDSGDWDLLDEEELDDEKTFEDDEVWTS